MSLMAIEELREVINEPFALARNEKFKDWTKRWLVVLHKSNALGGFYPDCEIDEEVALKMIRERARKEFSDLLGTAVSEQRVSDPNDKIFPERLIFTLMALRAKPNE